MKLVNLTLVLLALFMASSVQALTIYVDKSNTTCTTCDGSSWIEPLLDLQPALAVAGNGDEIRIAEGTYYPTGQTVITSPTIAQRAVRFEIGVGLTIRGGYATGGSANPNPTLYPTILSGNIDQNATNSSNSFTVLFVPAYNPSVVIVEGLTITDGNADTPTSSQLSRKGGGVYIGPNTNGRVIMSNCIIEENDAPIIEGGGIYSNGRDLLIEDCEIRFNNSYRGGGIFQELGVLEVLNTQFVSNTTSVNGIGGALVSYDSDDLHIDRCTFKDNFAHRIGAVYIRNSEDAIVVNSIFQGNFMNQSGTLYTHGCSNTRVLSCSFTENVNLAAPNTNNRFSCISGFQSGFNGDNEIFIYNSIFWDNRVSGDEEVINNTGSYTVELENCIMEGGWINPTQDALFNILDQDPDWIGSSLELDVNSPAINTGDNAWTPSTYTVDYDGTSRFISTIDMGAQESLTCFINGTLNVIQANCNGTQASMSVSGLSGTGPYTYNWTNSASTSSISNLPAGIYSVTVTDAGGCTFSASGTIFSGASNLFVKQNNPCTSGCNGANWNLAFTDLQDALAIACPGTIIWVAEGTYYPATMGNQSVSFDIPSGVSVYGGFEGTETALSEADPIANETVLSGDLNQDGLPDATSSFNIVTSSSSITNDILLNGLIVENGRTTSNGAGAKFQSNGGAASVILERCTFRYNDAGNLGGGIYSQAELNISECTFDNNIADKGGPGIAINGKPLNLLSSVFTGNSTDNINGIGGAINFTNSSNGSIESSYFDDNWGFKVSTVYFLSSNNNVITNSIFKNNSCDRMASIYTLSSSNTKIINCSFSGNENQHANSNQASCIGTHLANSGAVYVYNCAFWDNQSSQGIEVMDYALTTIDHCLIEGGWNGTLCTVNTSSIITTNPNWTGQYLDLQSGSPAIDAGSNSFVPTGITTDFDGPGPNRFFNSTGTPNALVDMGAQEYQSTYKRSFANDDSEQSEVNVYPNPSSGEFNVKTKSFTAFILYDVSGRVVLSGQWEEGMHTLDLTRYDAGIYHLVTDVDQMRTSLVKL